MIARIILNVSFGSENIQQEFVKRRDSNLLDEKCPLRRVLGALNQPKTNSKDANERASPDHNLLCNR